MRFGLIVVLLASVFQFSVVYSQSCSTLKCTQKCDSTSTPPKCTCFTGYELQNDGKTCLDINECQRSSSLCTANDAPLCRNTEGSYICTGCGADSNITWQYYKRSECCKIDTTATCGKSTSTSGRIVGGAAARISNWPWTAYLSIGGDACGGTLIADNLVLTTAHCIQNASPSQVTVTLGVSNFHDTSNVHRQTFTISKFERHPDFDSLRLQNDVAILWLSTPAIIGLYVAPICMPNGQVPPDGEKCWATGYGSLAEGGSTPQPLQEVDVPIVNVHTCAAVYQSFTQKVVPSTMLCAGYQEGGKDACQGDSGGPLVCQRCDSCSWYLAGITAFGRGCGRANSYGVYTKISAFESWIASKTQLSHVVKPCTLPTWLDWSEWSLTCPSCGPGTRKRTRVCSNGAVGVPGCVGSTTETENCPNNPCTNTSWGSFLPWGACSKLCGSGTRTRSRPCVGGPVGSSGCPASEESETEACNTQACGTWGDWVWGDCSVTCGGGTRTGARACDTKGGTTVCVGTSSLTGVCGAAQCVDTTCKDKLTDCGTLSSLCQQTAYVSLMRDICPQTCGLCGGSSWSGWTNDGTCSVTCGTGVQKQIRTCNGGTAGAGGCPGSTTQTIACNVQACPTQGSWSEWSNSGTCTVTCGSGIQQQIRTCNGGTAGAGGCPGSLTQTIACNQQACPPQGSWSSWSNSGTCTVTCGGGIQQQIRTCNGGTAGAGGCPGSTTQTIACNEQACPPVGSWGTWVNSGSCSKECGTGAQQQTRTCNGGTPGVGGCPGSATQSIPCNQHACPVLGSWSSWVNSGTCSVSCMQQQTRICTGGTAGQGGCLGSTTQSVTCTGGSCQPQSGCEALIDQTITSTCVSYASFGYCDTYATFMQNNCAKTCCTKRGGGCLDVDLDPSCPSKKNLCHFGTVQAFCRKTCNPACNTKK